MSAKGSGPASFPEAGEDAARNSTGAAMAADALVARNSAQVRSARIGAGDTGLLMLHGVYQVIGKPCGGLVQPLQLIFLRPGVVIAAAGFQFLDIARQPFRHRLINVHRMFGPAAVAGDVISS